MGLLDLLGSLFTKKPETAERVVDERSPVVDADFSLAPEQQTPERRQRLRINARPGTRALIIDDSPTIVAALRKILRSGGFETLEAFNAELGLEIAFREQPELIFLDIVLPGMNGFAALRTMRRDPRTSHIPIIMISGNEHATEEYYGGRIGADDFMKKPFSRYEVFARIEQLLDADLSPKRRPAPPAAPPAAAVVS